MLTRRLPASRRALSATSSRAGARVPIVRKVTTTAPPPTPFPTPLPPPPPQPKAKRGAFTRVLLYTSFSGAVFYAGGTLVALNNERYRDFFVESVPLGEACVDYVEEQGWDTTTLGNLGKKSWSATKTGYKAVEGAVNRTLGNESSSRPLSSSSAPASVDSVLTAAASLEQKGAEKMNEAAHQFTEALDKIRAKGIDLAENVTVAAENVVGKNVDTTIVETTRAEPVAEVVSPTTDSSSFEAIPEPEAPVIVLDGIASPATQQKKIYTQPLPLGFSPPPGFTLPVKEKIVKKEEDTSVHAPLDAPPAPEPLPLVAPTVSELGASEPVIAQLATTIDSLAAFLRDNPNATGAKDVLETAQSDLVHFGDRLEKVKEEERKKLEDQLEEQAREYSTAILELELTAQDKIDQQEEGWKSMFDEERQRVATSYREKLERELVTQSEIINERLKEEVIAQGIEMQRRWIREIKIRVEQERGGRLAKLEDLASDLKKLERVTLDNSSYLDENIRIHTLWSAIRALTSALDAPTRQPFREELRVLMNVTAARDDPIIATALDSLENTKIPDVGVEPLGDLVSWFTTSVSPRVEGVALVPDETAGVLSHVASSIISAFRFKRQGPVEGSDVLSVLARAEHHMNEKDLESATRELNQLRGWPKVLLADWLAAARARLEAQQAIEIIQAQATLASLLVV